MSTVAEFVPVGTFKTKKSADLAAKGMTKHSNGAQRWTACKHQKDDVKGYAIVRKA